MRTSIDGFWTPFVTVRSTKRHPRTLSWHERIAGLSSKRQELLRPVLEDPRDYLFLSIRALAVKLRTDTATLMRSIRQMGFGGYPEFRRYLHELAIANVTSLDSMLSGSGSDSEMPAHLRESLESDQKNLVGVRNALDTRQVARLAEMLWSARRVILLGGDLASTLVFYLEHHLVMLGLPVFSATSTARVVHLVRTVNDKDLVLALSFHRCLRQTVEGMRQARTKGAHCVGITDTFVSPIARFADESFIVSVETRHFGDSYVGAMALMNVILVACANYRRKRVLELAREAAEEQKFGFRWYND